MNRTTVLITALSIALAGPAVAETTETVATICDAIPAEAASTAMGIEVTQAQLGQAGASEYCDYTFTLEDGMMTNVFVRRLDPAVEFMGPDAAAALTARAGFLGAAPKQDVDIGDQAILFRGNLTLVGLVRVGEDIYTIESSPEYLTDESLLGLMQATADAFGKGSGDAE